MAKQSRHKSELHDFYSINMRGNWWWRVFNDSLPVIDSVVLFFRVKSYGLSYLFTPQPPSDSRGRSGPDALAFDLITLSS